MLTLKNDLKKEMYEIANVTSAGTGAGSGSLNSSTGVSKLIGQSESMDVVPKENYRIFLKRIYRTMFELIVGNLKKVERRIDNHDPDVDAEYGFEDFDLSKMKDLEYNINMDIRLTRSEIEQQKQEVMQIMSLQAQSGKEILTEATIIELMNFPDKDRILATLHEQKQGDAKQREMQIATAAAMAMAQEIQNPQGGNESASVQDMAQMAATEAVQEVDSQKKGGGNQQQVGGAAGAAAPQPQAQAAGKVPQQ